MPKCGIYKSKCCADNYSYFSDHIHIVGFDENNMNTETVLVVGEKMATAGQNKKIKMEEKEQLAVIKCKLLLPTAVLPKKGYPDSNCYDLYAPNQLVLQPFATLIVDLGK